MHPVGCVPAENLPYSGNRIPPQKIGDPRHQTSPHGTDLQAMLGYQPAPWTDRRLSNITLAKTSFRSVNITKFY